jgi:hypothetical protein
MTDMPRWLGGCLHTGFPEEYIAFLASLELVV